MNVPWVGVPVRVIVKLLVELSKNVLFCCPFVPVVSKSSVVLLKLGSVTAPAAAGWPDLDAANILGVVLCESSAVPASAIREETVDVLLTRR